MVSPTIPITVIIPTRERGDVLAAALRNVCAQNYDGLDILVSDNCSSDGTADVVGAVNDPRVRYVNTGRRLSMSHNWEFALSHVPVDNRYVMVIGDDDGIVPGALERIAALIRETSAKAINSNFVTFIWPNAENSGMGRLLVPMRTGHEIRDSKEWLRRVLEGRAWYSELPMLYAGGAVHVSVIDAVRQKKGTFFQSCQPDIFSSVALSCATESYAFSHEPFAIAGHSRHSNGASWSASGNGASSSDALKANQMFSSEANIPWHADIPTLPDGNIPLSVDLLVYESYLQAMYLHDDVFKLERTDMLALFLARDVADRQRIATWNQLFAQRHGLDFSTARTEAMWLRLRVKRDRLLENARAFLEYYRLEPSFGIPMRDVYEASVVAATLLRTRPGRLKSYLSTIARRLGRAPTVTTTTKTKPTSAADEQ
jgi:hypothetical protein